MLNDSTLKSFCEFLSNDYIFDKSPPVALIYDSKYQIKQIKSFVSKELVNRKEDAIDILNYLINEVEATEYQTENVGIECVKRWLDKFDITIEEILNYENRGNEIYKFIEYDYTYYPDMSIERSLAVDMQYDFLVYLRNYFASQLLDFLNEKKQLKEKQFDLQKPVTTKENKPNQLTANQIVILLDRLGLLAHPDIEDLSRSKQAELISLISGLNKKNFEKYIDKLEDSKPTKNYQKDIKKIDKILDDLI